MTPVSEVMTRGVRSVSPSDTLRDAAQAMHELNVGSLPVCENDRVVGMVTDRDITVRGIAQGREPGTPLREVMSPQPQSCFEDESVDDVILAMRDEQIRRVPVLDREQRLVGMLTLGDVAAKYDAFEAGVALAGISEPAAPVHAAGPGGVDIAKAWPSSEPRMEEAQRVAGLLRS